MSITEHLRPFPSNPLYLGGLPRGDDGGNDNDNDNKIDRDSTYGTLRRAAKLPPCPFPTACMGTITNDFNKLWDGDFHVVVEVGDDGGLALLASPNSDSEDERGTEDSVVCCQFVFAMKGGAWALLTFPDPPRNPESLRFRDSLTSEQQLALSVRVFHQLLRSRGVDYPYTTYPHLYEHLLGIYNFDQQFKLSLDLLLVKFDSLMNQRDVPMATIASELKEVGEMLESRGKFHEAAKVYQETIEVFFTHDTNQRPPEFDKNFPQGQINGSEFAMVWSYAGLAYKRADKLKESEEAMVKALYHYRIYRGWGRFVVRDDFVSMALRNMHLLYDSWVSRPDDTDEIYPILWAFLVVVHNQGFSNFPAGEERILDSLSYMKVRREFKSRRGAGRLFERALQTPSVMNFRSEILSVFPEGFISRMRPTAVAPPSKSESQKFQRKAARSVAGAIKCSNPACPISTKTPKRCPCGQVAYCQKDCQLAHWPKHKKLCPCKTKKATHKLQSSTGIETKE